MNEQLKITDDAWKNFGSSVEDVLDKIVDGSADWKDILKSLIPVMKDLVLELIRAQSIGQGGGGNSGLGGVFGSLFGGLFGGKSSDPWSGLRLAGGGLVSGPGSGTSDSVPARLSNGEFVVNATATKLFRPLLEAINDNKPLALARGGYVGAFNDVGSNIVPLPSPSSIPTDTGRGGGGSQDVNVTTDVKISFDKDGNPLAAVDSRIDRKIAANNKMRDKSAAVTTANAVRAGNPRGYYTR